MKEKKRAQHMHCMYCALIFSFSLLYTLYVLVLMLSYISAHHTHIRKIQYGVGKNLERWAKKSLLSLTQFFVHS